MEFEQYRVAIVDDLDVNLVVASDILSSLGCEIVTAKNGRELFSMLDEVSVDLILLDIMLPGIDGYEICRFLKGDREKAHIPIIFLTAKNDREDVVKGFDCGGVDFITKPFYAKELLYRVKAQLETRERIRLKELHEKERFENIRRESVSELITNIAHHWRQPLNVMSLASMNAKIKAQKNGCSDEELANLLDMISSSCLNLSNIIEIFKNRAKKDDDIRVIPLGKTLEDTLMIVLDSRLSRMDIINNIPENLEINTSYTTLSEVFMIILKNVIEVSEERGITNSMVIFDANVGSGSVKLSIRDNLGGIKDDLIERVFDPYMTTFFPTSHKGLGLYIAKRLVEEELEGSIKVVNVENGLQIDIDIPIQRRGF